MALFNGKHVQLAGQVLAIISAAVVLRGGHAIGFGVAEAVYCLATTKPQLFNWLKNFAEPTKWPAYVSLGIAGMFAAHQGGFAAISLAGILMTIDGLFFDSLY
jgi:hypothetical protein